MKICIASKDRSSFITTHLLFKPEDVLIFVEPHEVKRYQTFWPDYTIIDIQKSNQSICYVRNYIIDYVKENKIVMADDDIFSFGVRNDEYRYTDLVNTDEMLKDIEEGLNSYATYSIPFSAFAFFENKASKNQKRFYIDIKIARCFYGINLEKIHRKNIKYDPRLDVEDIDFTIQILLNDEHCCTDFQYLLRTPIFTLGGLRTIRKLDALTLDSIFRREIKQITEKYGAEFINFSHDAVGYVHSCSINVGLLMKRKEIARKNYEEYLSRV